MRTLEIIVATVAEEFSDLDDTATITRVTVRLTLAVLLGGILGYEREQRGKAAGLRTHMLVCLGAALFILGGSTTGIVDDPMSRVIQGVVAGIGFLCAGTIIKNDNVHRVQGLTTAAGIWFAAAIGIAVGLGQVAMAILSTGLALIVLHGLPLLFRNPAKRKNRQNFD